MGFYAVNGHILNINESNHKSILLHHHLMRKENHQRLIGDLPRGYFKTTLRNISESLNFSVSTTRKLLKDFEDMGIITCVKKSNNSHEQSIYRYVFDNNEETIDCSINETNKSTLESSDSNDKSESNETVNRTNNESVNCTYKKELTKKNYKKDTYYLIISRLNERANKNFRANTSKTKSLIDARLKEKFTLEDFYTVIEHKANSWMGTDMEIYLRPWTLFGTKFEYYLNEVSLNSKTNENTDNNWEPDFCYE